jgi:hypothetical protein
MIRSIGLFGKLGLRSLQAPRAKKESAWIQFRLALSCITVALAMPGQLNLNLAAVAFISPQNHPILVRALSGSPEDLLKYHYIAHTSLDVIDERS